MISVLINAYACAPNMGSEQGMAWNWIINLANYCKVFVITEGEWKIEIEDAIKQLPQGGNMIFYYNPVSDKIRRMCWNQGDWRFYYYYKKWQKETLEITKEIIKNHSIDIVHQLNMIGFREPGYLWKIDNIPFVWGPIGGMENIPESYLDDLAIKQKLIILLKNRINNFQTRFSSRVLKSINKADALIAAVKGVKDKIELYHHKKIILINETGCYPNESKLNNLRKTETFFDVIWVGKFDFRKQLGMALKIISKIKYLDGLRFHIIGNGSKTELHYYTDMAMKLGIEDICIWHGLISHSNVQQIMRDSDLLLFTSIMEGTPHVVLEAIGNNLPVICLNSCGQADAVNDSVGIKLEVTSQKQSTEDFAEKMAYLHNNRNILKKMSNDCFRRQEELSWDTKVNQMVEIYRTVLKKHENISG